MNLAPLMASFLPVRWEILTSSLSWGEDEVRSVCEVLSLCPAQSKYRAWYCSWLWCDFVTVPCNKQRNFSSQKTTILLCSWILWVRDLNIDLFILICLAVLGLSCDTGSSLHHVRSLVSAHGLSSCTAQA